MATINLLPWREERRQLIKQQFLVVLGGVAVLGALLVLLGVSVMNSAISDQEGRNRYIQTHIDKLNREVREISDLEKRRQQLIDRMNIIQDLQGTRPLIVRVFDEMVRTLPDGLFFTSVVRRGNSISVEGIAESNNRVSSLMRKLDGSPWFDDPNLTAVSAASRYGEQASTFRLSFKISAPKPDQDKKKQGWPVAFQEWIDEVRQFDFAELDMENIGAWPVLVRAAVWVLVFALCLVGGYFYFIADLRVELAAAEAKELKLKKEFENKAFRAAKLEPLKKQMKEMEASFGILLSQLPADTEVPGLLEDMTEKAVSNGLEIQTIRLQREQVREFYVELPIAIEVSGTYHDLAAFVSGIAGLPRIVTLHDYKINSNDQLTNQSMSITAKTYRYKDLQEGS